MVLDGENGQFLMAQAFYRAVIQIEMSDFQRVGQTIRIHCIAMVLGGNVSPAGSQVSHRMISAPVAEFQFEGLAAEGVGDKLISQADAHDRL